MTRRERMMRIIENMGQERADWELGGMMGRRGRFKRFEILTERSSR